MSTRMLIDAAHPEETRVAVVSGNRIEEFDFEAANKSAHRGNVYLARVTRVEPSLQAAFVEYGGDRHGFLSFSEIHPDYYQIPVEDRRALLEEEAREHASSASDEDGAEEKPVAEGDGGAEVEEMGADDGLDDANEVRRKPVQRHYKIQEVIKKRQILLVQVVKEERGNKGAALTTYLSLAGRYCVLMPNTARGGGISRKIATPVDRKRLKAIMSELDVPKGMGCIIRTAGASRTKPEIKRDYGYLTRLWDNIRELTLKSIAPALIYKEGDLIKRAIRDMYSSDIEEIFIEGPEAYKSARDFMKMLMPSHTKRVKQYKEDIPLFHRFQVESQLEGMYSATVPLKSGGYLVINPTEALVAVDVNSGRSTKERNIERTAHKTNLEAAQEVARQLRLRDLAGLIVIDFIDMEESRNNRSVERKLKECLKTDRARLQVGRISAFGLMEMSRQRLRPGLLEASTGPCPVCEGTGAVRSVESSALQLMRTIEEEGIRGRAKNLAIKVPFDVANYILNNKRNELVSIEGRFNIIVEIKGDQSLHRPHFEVIRSGQNTSDGSIAAVTPNFVDEPAFVDDDTPDSTDEPVAEEQDQHDEPPKPSEPRADDESSEDGEPRKRRRRGRRGGRKRWKDQDGTEVGEGQLAPTIVAVTNGEMETNDDPSTMDQPVVDAEVAPEWHASESPHATASTEDPSGEAVDPIATDDGFVEPESAEASQAEDISTDEVA
ncbi:MAG: ribonuclease E/G, partial [Proteobacteria bacterium]|nr:ribonuclease E/G [Pseudomonadota bacterium]